jgi:hypothetical protein
MGIPVFTGGHQVTLCEIRTRTENERMLKVGERERARRNGVFWDVMPCSSCRNRRFEGRYHLYHHCDKNR